MTVMMAGGFPDNVTSLLLDLYSDYRAVREGKVGWALLCQFHATWFHRDVVFRATKTPRT